MQIIFASLDEYIISRKSKCFRWTHATFDSIGDAKLYCNERTDCFGILTEKNIPPTRFWVCDYPNAITKYGLLNKTNWEVYKKKSTDSGECCYK